MHKNMTQIKVYYLGYNREKFMKGFNPTFSDTDTIINYNFIEKVKNGVVESNKIYSDKFKFFIINSNFKVKGLNFLEVTFKTFSTNALFYQYHGEYKEVTIEFCHFDLI
jgi:hypothetical protein